MKVTVVDMHSNIKVIVLQKEEGQSKPTLTKCIIQETEGMTETLKFVQLRTIMKENDLQNNDMTIFLLSNSLICMPNNIENSIDKAIVQKALKQMLTGDTLDAKDKFKKLFSRDEVVKKEVKSDDFKMLKITPYTDSDFYIHSLLFSISNQMLKEYKQLIKLLNLKNVILTEYDHLSNLDIGNYSIMDIGATKTKVVKVINNKIENIDMTNEGSDTVLKKLGLPNKEDHYTFDATRLLELGGDISVTFANIRNMRQAVVPPGVCYTTGGGSGYHFVEETKDVRLIPLSEITTNLLSNKNLPEPLMRYIDTLVLAGNQALTGNYPYNILGTQLDIQSPALRQLVHRMPDIQKTAIAGTSLLLTTAFILFTARGMYNSNLYQSNVFEAMTNIPSIYTSAYPVQKQLMTDNTALVAELETMYTEAEERLLALKELENPRHEGTEFNEIVNDVASLTSANIVSMKRSDDEDVVFTFRGNIGDVPKVEKILTPYYSSVTYGITNVDDLNTFSLITFTFECHE